MRVDCLGYGSRTNKMAGTKCTLDNQELEIKERRILLLNKSE